MAKVYRSAKVVLNLLKEFSNRREYKFFVFVGHVIPQLVN
jgi:hypothetical protein